MKTVIVTGSEGFIGKHVVRALRAKDYDVVGVDLKNGKDYDYGLYFVNNPVPKDAILIHLAAFTEVIESFHRPADFWHNNMLGLQFLLGAFPEDCKIVFASTSAVYGDQYPRIDPTSPYAASKYAAECFLRNNFKNTVALRFFNVYGPGMKESKYKSVIKAFMDARKKGDALVINNTGEQVRDFVHVDDIVRGILGAISAKPGVYDLSTGKGTSVNEIAKMIGGKKKYQKLPVKEPMKIIGNKQKWLPKWTPKVKLSEGIEMLKKPIK